MMFLYNIDYYYMGIIGFPGQAGGYTARPAAARGAPCMGY